MTCTSQYKTVEPRIKKPLYVIKCDTSSDFAIQRDYQIYAYGIIKGS